MSDGIGNCLPLWDRRLLQDSDDFEWLEHTKAEIGMSQEELFHLMYVGDLPGEGSNPGFGLIQLKDDISKVTVKGEIKL